MSEETIRLANDFSNLAHVMGHTSDKSTETALLLLVLEMREQNETLTFIHERLLEISQRVGRLVFK